MTLVQIDLQRGRDPRATSAAPAAGMVVAPAAAPTSRAVASLLGVGLILLVPLAEPALRNGPTLALLLVGLGMLGLLAVLLRPVGEVDPS